MYYTSNTIEEHDRAVTIRRADTAEWDAIDRLAQRDSAPPPPRDEMLVAEVGGEMRAAVAVRNGYAIADPFAPSAELVDLLRARAEQIAGPDRELARSARPSVFSLEWLRGPDRSQAR
ncbi:MAG TPA: hypothetical protein VFY99_09285 [Solirubrobacterales bacterium]